MKISSFYRSDILVFRSQIFGGTSQKKWKKIWHNLWKVLSDPCGPGARLAPGLKPLRLPRARKQGIDPFVANQSAIFHMWAVAIEQHVGQHETITPSREIEQHQRRSAWYPLSSILSVGLSDWACVCAGNQDTRKQPHLSHPSAQWP